MFSLVFVKPVFAQTATPLVTLIPTPVPTIIINPSNNIYITEISPTSDTEWTEIYNANENQVQLVKWKLQTETTTRNIPDKTIINPKSYFIFNSTNFLSDSVSKTVKIIDQNNQQIDLATSYLANLDNGLSWSKQSDDSWCETYPSLNQSNNSCYIPPTPIPPTSTPIPTNKPTNIPTPTKTNTPTPTKIIIPTPSKIPQNSELVESTISAILESAEAPEATETPTITLVPTSGEILGDSTKSATKKNFLPLIFIISGGVLLLTPLIISKIKK